MANTVRKLITLSLLLGEGDEPPKEFRLFAAGVNTSEKGSFLFDDQAAASVMSAYARHGKALLFDYNHGTTFAEPTLEQAISAGEFTPEVREDGLYAANIKWTPRAAELIKAREYRFFSPAFESDKKTGRVTRLVNCALTNLPALDNIEPLIAANALLGEKMEEQLKSQIADLTTKLSACHSEIGTLRAKLSVFEEKQPEVTAAVTLRANVLNLAGKKTDDEAIGVLLSLKSSHEQFTALRAQLDEEKIKRLSADFNRMLDEASDPAKSPKLTPANRPFWESIAKEDGYEKGLTRLTAYLETATTLSVGQRPAPANGSGPAMSDQQKFVAKRLGISEKAWQESESKRLGGAQS